MEIKEKIIEPFKRKIYILKDELGNTATGKTYNEALSYLLVRRNKEKERKRY